MTLRSGSRLSTKGKIQTVNFNLRTPEAVIIIQFQDENFTLTVIKKVVLTIDSISLDLDM